MYFEKYFHLLTKLLLKCLIELKSNTNFVCFGNLDNSARLESTLFLSLITHLLSLNHLFFFMWLYFLFIKCLFSTWLLVVYDRAIRQFPKNPWTLVISGDVIHDRTRTAQWPLVPSIGQNLQPVMMTSPYMSEKFSGGTKNPKQTNKTNQFVE